MEPVNEVVIVSAFGRGNWLAGELATHGWNVALVDTTAHLGKWEPVDWEGPFGVFHSDHLRPSQLFRLGEDDELVSVPEGYTIWMRSGPMEFRSSLSRFLLEKKGISPAVEDYLLRFKIRQPQLVAEERKILKRAPFNKAWLAHYAHQVGSNVFQPNAEALNTRYPMRLFSPLSLRRVTREGFERGLKQCRDRGVTVYSPAKVQDVGFTGRQMDAIEIASERSGILRGKIFLWMLSSEETQMLPESVHRSLFPYGPVVSSWCWLRYRFRLEAGIETQVLPLKFVLMGDIHLPWTHTNLIQVQRCEANDEIDAWIRIPTQHRFDKAYLQKMMTELSHELTERMPLAAPECIGLPAEFQHAPEEIGAPRFPVFDEAPLAGLSRLRLKNLFFDGPETWESLDWVGQMVHQSETLTRLESIKAAWEAAKLKGMET